MKFRSAFPALCSLLLGAGLSSAFAVTIIWDGGGADNNWSTADNWNTNSVPATASPYDDVQFAGSTRPAVNVDSNVTIQTLGFNSGAAAFTIGGTGTINVVPAAGSNADSGNEIRNTSSALQTIDANVTAGGTVLGIRALNGNMTFNGNIDLTAATNTRFLGSSGRTMTLNGVISGTGGGAVAYNNGLTAVINGVNTYTKSTSIWTATVKVTVDALSGQNGAFGNSTTALNMGTTYDGGALTATLLASNAVEIGRNIQLASAHINRANQPHVYTIGGDTAHVSNYTGTITNSNTGTTSTQNASKLTVTAASGGRVNIANIVRGSGALGSADDVVKTGLGIVTITGANNNWQGNTLIQAGTFLVNGTVLTNPSFKDAQVSAGATLGGEGTFRRDATLAAAAFLSPGDMDAAGNSLGGSLAIGDGAGLTLAAGTFLNFDLGAASSLLDDEVNVLGSLALAGVLNVTDIGGFGAGEYKLFDWTGSLTFNPADLTFGSMPAGYNYSIDTTTYANSAYLVVTPEPGRALLLVIALGSLVLRRRRFPRQA